MYTKEEALSIFSMANNKKLNDSIDNMYKEMNSDKECAAWYMFAIYDEFFFNNENITDEIKFDYLTQYNTLFNAYMEGFKFDFWASGDQLEIYSYIHDSIRLSEQFSDTVLKTQALENLKSYINWIINNIYNYNGDNKWHPSQVSVTIDEFIVNFSNEDLLITILSDEDFCKTLSHALRTYYGCLTMQCMDSSNQNTNGAYLADYSKLLLSDPIFQLMQKISDTMTCFPNVLDNSIIPACFDPQSPFSHDLDNLYVHLEEHNF